MQEVKGGFGNFTGYGASRFDEMQSFGSTYSTPGWQRAKARGGRGGFEDAGGHDFDQDAAVPSRARPL